MRYRFQEYSPGSFESEPELLYLDGKPITVLSFCEPGLEERPPVVLFGGAFTNHSFFKLMTRVLMKDFPVVLMDLPGQGTNPAIGDDFDFPDFADLLESFCEINALPKIIPCGLSYGSGIAFTFAARYPHRVEKMILAGAALRLRPSLKRKLEESIHWVESGQLIKFAEGAPLYIFNLPERETTGLRAASVERLKTDLLNLDEIGLRKYVSNTRRICELKELKGSPECPTLVVIGEYDNFLTPAENHELARRCRNAAFALMAGVDHLIPVEKPRQMARIYSRFLLGKSLDDLPDIKYFEDRAASAPAARPAPAPDSPFEAPFEGLFEGLFDRPIKRPFDRRIAPRISAHAQPVQVDGPSGRSYSARLIDIGFEGFYLTLDEGGLTPEDRGDDLNRVFRLHIAGPDLHMDFVAELNAQSLRGFFLKDSLRDFERLSEFIAGDCVSRLSPNDQVPGSASA